MHLNTLQITEIDQDVIEDMVDQALLEDIESGDINALLIDEDEQVQAKVITREDMVLCGKEWVLEVYRQVDPEVTLHWHYQDGDQVKANETLFEVEGLARGILTAERTALNFLQMLSAVATKTQHYVAALKNYKTKILDTRKTIPGFRLAEKYAVSCGGGVNHRIGLFDAFLIKENHIAACGHSISQAVAKARAIGKDKLIEVEVENFDELNEAIEAKCDVIMLDNFSLQDMAKAVKLVDGKAELEASGNMTFEQLEDVAKTGVDYISTGGLTKHIQAIDLSMRFI
ncbi:carboxylating nicotinate-nucleotide diphosphorylase [Fangia hongkongensis]|uniref:carboxylating nicotinate-nucleotide diphosphorylase n=1 Tax=Fangia hongkongensis TaxID=270495 RepID=UPI0003721889|nr:carboxylating nicotinate-nucleotide diphosphorylase [Fangia hongkongensis]MBK2126324.1 carboxylating nicotinate-nucleotide diphosphorylase [Fangia hongkongensis]